MSEPIQIGSWAFFPETGQLDNGLESNRLEHRASSLLELLARNAGSLVSHAEIIDKVWEGRAVSSNSVAVVISDIRRALADDSKAPRFIETIPKRGYRLIAEDSNPSVPDEEPNLPQRISLRRGRVMVLVVLGLALLGVFALPVILSQTATEQDVLVVGVLNVENETGSPAHDPLSVSVTELLSVYLAQHESVRLAADGSSQIMLSGKLVLWNGEPSMTIYARSVNSGEVIWTGMASGPETMLPRQTYAEVGKFVGYCQSSCL